MLKVFINGTGNISPQKTFEPEKFLEELINFSGDRLTCIEPDYEPYIDARLQRRMSRIIRMSWCAAKICLDDAGVKIPDAIITGTGMGCLEDTEKFLNAIFENDERFLPPTPFIQSTHNTIGAQIALMLNCTNYNLTYTQRGIAFENAMSDAISLLTEPEYKNILVGGFDEMTDNQMVLYNRLRYYKKDITNNLDLLSYKNSGTIAGEGNVFFLLSSEPNEKSYAGIQGIFTFNYPHDIDSVLKKIDWFLSGNGLNFGDIDLFITGLNGDIKQDRIYHEVINCHFFSTPSAYFKHLCGEYHTASAFALWLAANILKRQSIPDIIKLNRISRTSVRKVLIYNNYMNYNHSLILLSAC